MSQTIDPTAHDVAAPGGTGPHAAAPDEIAFPHGLPGFPGATRFRLVLPAPGPEGLLLLQCVDRPELRFLVLPYGGQGLPLRSGELDQACRALGLATDHAAVLLVVTRRPQPDADRDSGLYVNLRAPVLVDTERRTAVQHVLPDTELPVRHPLPLAA